MVCGKTFVKINGFSNLNKRNHKKEPQTGETSSKLQSCDTEQPWKVYWEIYLGWSQHPWRFGGHG